MNAIWVTVASTRGSVPRDVGTAMKVTAERIEGTVGGGALEHQAIAQARKMLARGDVKAVRQFPLGPALGQCCGGAVTLAFSTEPGTLDPAAPACFDAPKRRRQEPLWIWGAGHVGRAVVQAAPPNAFDIMWVDTDMSRFPKRVPSDVTALPATDMPRLAARAPRGAHHLIFTYSHDIDLELCAALLTRDARSILLIGSDTKRARFFKRLRAMGHDPAPITCPIGDKSLGKAPAAIAHGTVAQLLAQRANTLPA